MELLQEGGKCHGEKNMQDFTTKVLLLVEKEDVLRRVPLLICLGEVELPKASGISAEPIHKTPKHCPSAAGSGSEDAV